MNDPRTATRQLQRPLGFFVACCLLLLSSPLFAVTKHIALAGADGQALANVTITIQFPDGTTKEEETDDRGILIFDFPGDGRYTLMGPDGRVLQTVAVGVPVAGAGLVAGAVGAAAVVLVAATSGDSGSSGGGTGGGAPTSGPAGNYRLSFGSPSNPQGHPDLIAGGPVDINLQTSGSSVSISQTSSVQGFTDVSGSLSGSSISASGSGAYSTCNSSSALFSASYDSATNTLSGTYTQTIAGGFAYCTGSIIWSFTGSAI